jgi:hypothetical protein
MHTTQVRLIGTVDLATQIIHVKGYSAGLPPQLVHVQGGNGFMIQIEFCFSPGINQFYLYPGIRGKIYPGTMAFDGIPLS